MRPSDRVLDFGAGRGEHILDERIDYRRELFNLKGRCAHLEGADLDDAVLGNPFIDHAVVLQSGDRLPYENDSFDIVLSRFVFEHIANPEVVSSELMRILKPGGVIAALTPNKYGYIAIAGRAIPNSLHVKWLKAIQPKRKSEDVFPTTYRLNTRKQLTAAFGPRAEIFVAYIAGEPAYYFGNPVVYSVTKWLHRHLPERCQPLMMIFIRKPE